MKLLKAIACIVENPNNAIHTGMIKPPPPIPPLLAIPSKIGRSITPAISELFCGSTSLCSQTPFWHFENLLFVQSEVKMQV